MANMIIRHMEWLDIANWRERSYLTSCPLPIDPLSVVTTEKFVKWNGKKQIHDPDAGERSAVRSDPP